jgi:tRNA A-37 threonylcarbamoyl transferase component Bud32
MTQVREKKSLLPWESSLPSGDLLPGETVGDYVIEGFLAEGGCGTVYVGRHSVVDRRAAIKVLRGALASSPRMVERFVREVDLVNLLRHPNIVEIHELGQLVDGRPYYTMELLEGSTLDAVLRADGRFPPAEALEILEPVCNALRAAHAAGIVHRDVKASNIFIPSQGGTAGIKLLDFGIAKLTDPGTSSAGLTTFGHPVGTPTAMAPEQILGETLDERVDIYALGVLLHRMLTGVLPFRSADSLELARQHLEDPAPRPSRVAPVSPAVDEVVLRCLEKRPEKRFDSVKSFLSALRLAAGASASDGVVEDTGERIARAAGIYVEVRVESQSEDLDDAMADDFGRILDLAEELLIDQSFSVVMVSGNAILAAHPLSDGDLDRGLDAQQALEIATSLHQALDRRDDADSRVHVATCMHVDDALVRTSAPSEIVGGAIVRMSSWAPPATAWGLFATPAALSGVSGFDATTEAGQMAKRVHPSSE